MIETGVTVRQNMDRLVHHLQQILGPLIAGHFNLEKDYSPAHSILAPLLPLLLKKPLQLHFLAKPRRLLMRT